MKSRAGSWRQLCCGLDAIKTEVRFVKMKHLLFARASIRSRALFAHHQVSLATNTYGINFLPFHAKSSELQLWYKKLWLGDIGVSSLQIADGAVFSGFISL